MSPMSCSISLLLLITAAGGDASWDAFLGAGRRDALARETRSALPLRWSEQDGVQWRQEVVGHGQSSPVVWGDTLYVTSVSGPMKDTFHLSAFDKRTGSPRWSRSFENGAKVKSSFYVSRAAPTPVVDADRVYAFFEGGDVVAVGHDGTEHWRRRLADDHGPFENRFGLSSSLCQHDDRVFVLVDHEGPSYLIALAKGDGRTLWRVERESRVSWSSPIAAVLRGQRCVLVSSAGSVDAYAADDGALLWSYTDLGGNTSNSPLLYDDDLILIGASRGRDSAASAEGARSNLLLQVIDDGEGGMKPVLRWRAERIQSSFSTPILHQGLAYFVNGTGVLSCLDGETGERIYAERLDHPVWATPLAVGERIYLFGRDGVTTVIRAGRDFEVLARNRLWAEDAVDPSASQGTPPGEEAEEPRSERERQPILYGYVVDGDDLILRAGAMLYRVGAIDV